MLDDSSDTESSYYVGNDTESDSDDDTSDSDVSQKITFGRRLSSDFVQRTSGGELNELLKTDTSNSSPKEISGFKGKESSVDVAQTSRSVLLHEFKSAKLIIDSSPPKFSQ